MNLKLLFQKWMKLDENNHRMQAVISTLERSCLRSRSGGRPIPKTPEGAGGLLAAGPSGAGAMAQRRSSTIVVEVARELGYKFCVANVVSGLMVQDTFTRRDPQYTHDMG